MSTASRRKNLSVQRDQCGLRLRTKGEDRASGITSSMLLERLDMIGNVAALCQERGLTEVANKCLIGMAQLDVGAVMRSSTAQARRIDS